MAATPGALLVDHVAVRNYSLRPLTLTLHTADALNTPQGDFAVLPQNQRSREVGTWIRLLTRRSTIVVPGRGITIIPFRVTLPANAQPGDHAGGITVTLESVARSPTGQTYKLLQSVGSRVFIRVSGPLRPGLTIEGLSVRYNAALWPFVRKSAVVTYTVRNTGNVALGGLQSVSARGLLFLRSSAEQAPDISLLLPGYAVRQRVEVRGVIPQIWMTAGVSITPLVLPGMAVGISGPFRSNAHFWAMPWLLIGILALVGWLLIRRRRRKASGDPGRRADSSPPRLEERLVEKEPDPVR